MDTITTPQLDLSNDRLTDWQPNYVSTYLPTYLPTYLTDWLTDKPIIWLNRQLTNELNNLLPFRPVYLETVTSDVHVLSDMHPQCPTRHLDSGALSYSRQQNVNTIWLVFHNITEALLTLSVLMLHNSKITCWIWMEFGTNIRRNSLWFRSVNMNFSFTFPDKYGLFKVAHGTPFDVQYVRPVTHTIIPSVSNPWLPTAGHPVYVHETMLWTN